MAKKANTKPNAGAADPTADDTADKPTQNVINTSPDPVGASDEDKKADQKAAEDGGSPSVGHINTTDSIDGDDELKPRHRKLTDADRKEIKKQFNSQGAVVANIASNFDIEPSEVFAIAEGK